MQKLDAHCHFWSLGRGDYDWLEGEGGPLAPIRRDYAPEDYPGDRKLIAVQAAATLAETDFLLDLAGREPRILGVVGWVDLESPEAVAQLEARAANPVFRGVRPMLQDIAEIDWLLRAPRKDALDALARLGLRFDLLITERHLPVAARFAAANPELPLVIDHGAKPQPGDRSAWAEGMRALARDRRIHCKLSGLMTEVPDPADLREVMGQLLDWFGPERLIWGSDWPVMTLAAPYEDWVAASEGALEGLTPDERAAVLGGNAARFYGVTP